MTCLRTILGQLATLKKQRCKADDGGCPKKQKNAPHMGVVTVVRPGSRSENTYSTYYDVAKHYY